MLKKSVLVMALAVLAVGKPVMAAQHPVITTVAVKHIRYHTVRPYADVKADLEQKLGRLDEPIRKLLAEGKVDELRAASTKVAGEYGLVIHYVALHGDWLILNGGRRNGIVYHIGNVLTAVQLTRQNFAAGLYAPLRLAIFEDGTGTTLEYDQPTSLLGQFHNAKIDESAASLDKRMARLVTDLCDGTRTATPRTEGGSAK
jgi:hypothetical protein